MHQFFFKLWNFYVKDKKSCVILWQATDNHAASLKFPCWPKAKHRSRTCRSTILASVTAVIGVSPCLMSFLSFHSKYIVAWMVYLARKVSSRLWLVSILRSINSDHFVVKFACNRPDIKNDQTFDEYAHSKNICSRVSKLVEGLHFIIL